MVRSSGWRAGVAVLLATLLVSGCGGARQAGGNASATASASTSQPPTTAAALDGCVASGQVELGNAQGAVLGAGPVGVVLSNQILGDMAPLI